jgi:hypothetical protein
MYYRRRVSYNVLMKLTYETGTATLVQFILLSFLNMANGANSVVTTCRKEGGGDCISNLLVSIIFFMLVVAWFGFVWVLGYAVQERRSKLLALGLIGAEILIIGVAYINIHGHTDALSLVTSVIDIILAVIIIFLSLRIVWAGDSRIVSHRRVRRRRHPS